MNYSVRLYKQREVGCPTKPMRIRKAGNSAEGEMFATAKFDFTTNEVKRDVNCRLGLINRLLPVNTITPLKTPTFAWKAVKKAIQRNDNTYTLKSVSEPINFTTVADLMQRILKFNGYHANELLYNRVNNEGKLRAVVNTMVEIDYNHVKHYINVHDIVIKQVNVIGAFRLTNKKTITKSKTQYLLDTRNIQMDEYGAVIDQQFESIKRTKTQTKVKQDGYYYDIYQIFICGNSLRKLERKIENMLAFSSIQ